MHPSVIADALPPSLAGKALRTAAPPLKASPCRGGGCAVKRRRRGTALSWAFTPAVWQALAAGWPCRIACWRVICPPKPSAPLRRGRCQRCPATPVSPPMLPGGRNRPPYRLGQTAGGTGSVVPTASVCFFRTPFAADRRAGVHARRLGPCRIARWRVVWTQSQVPPVPGAMPALPRNPCGGSNAARRAKSPALQYKAKTTSLRQGPPSRHSFPVNCRTGVHARRKTFRSMRFFGSMFTFARKPSASHQPLRKGRGIPAGEIAPSARFFEHAPGVRTAEIPHS